MFKYHKIKCVFIIGLKSTLYCLYLYFKTGCKSVNLSWCNNNFYIQDLSLWDGAMDLLCLYSLYTDPPWSSLYWPIILHQIFESVRAGIISLYYVNVTYGFVLMNVNNCCVTKQNKFRIFLRVFITVYTYHALCTEC